MGNGLHLCSGAIQHQSKVAHDIPMHYDVQTGGAGDQTTDLISTRPAVPPKPQLPWFSGMMCPFLATGSDCNIMMLRFLINQYITACSSSSE